MKNCTLICRQKIFNQSLIVIDKLIYAAENSIKPRNKSTKHFQNHKPQLILLFISRFKLFETVLQNLTVNNDFLESICATRIIFKYN